MFEACLKVASAASPHSFSITAFALLATTVFPTMAQAQIVPDSTLGDENSTVTEGASVRGDVADLIEGGATRGGNLFHSFLEFNVDEGQRVYFANPEGIESILSRITGGNPSNIFGTLGVDGTADLFLLNPNGIVFGENATLDIEGSFYATTGNAIGLGDEVFSATEPEQSRLLTVNPNVLFSNYLTDTSGDIENRGQLAVMGDLTLAGNQLDLQGQVAAGGDLTLLALDEVEIRDTAETPFIGFAGGDLLVQGNEQVDIVALSHPDSGLYSYGNMVLRSTNPVGGDAHYWSGGNFRVETLDGEAGNLYSPIDPIIRSLGDVVIDQYEGSSLHILAGGSVNIGTAEINAPDVGELGIDFLRETVTLSDGTIVEVDGGAQPTLDIRVGVSPEALGEPPLLLQTGFGGQDFFNGEGLSATETPSRADITIGDGYIDAENGLILLTNQYQPNPNIQGGNILVVAEEGIYGDGLDARGFGGQGGTIYLDSRQNVEVIGGFINTTGAGDVGNITLLASDTVSFDSESGGFVGAYSGVRSGTEGTSGDIFIKAANLEVLNGAQLSASAFGIGDAGNVTLEIAETLRLVGIDPNSGFSSGVFSRINSDQEGVGGNILIRATDLAILDGARIDASISGEGDGGNIDIEVLGNVILASDNGNRSFIQSDINGSAIGNGGDINITATSVTLQDGAFFSAETFGEGDSGDINITAKESISLEGIGDSRFNTLILNRVLEGAEGNGGNVNIFSGNSFSMTDRAQISVITQGMGNSGNVIIEADDTITLVNTTIFTEVSDGGASDSKGGEGDAGDITLRARSISLTEGSQLRLDTENQGNAGNAFIFADESLMLSGVGSATGRFSDQIVPSAISSTVEGNAVGEGGNISITVGQLSIDDDSFIRTSTSGEGNAGNIIILVDSLSASNGSQISASTFGVGNSGLVSINAQDAITLQGRDEFNSPSGIFSNVNKGSTGNSQGIEISTSSLIIDDRAQIGSSTAGNGNAGNISINALRDIFLDNSIIISEVTEDDGNGRGGSIFITANTLDLTNGSSLLADTENLGDAGSIFIDVSETVRLSGRGPGSLNPDQTVPSQISSTVESDAVGEGGDIRLTTRRLDISNSGFINASTFGQGNAGNIDISVDSLNALDGSQILASTSGVGNAGLVSIDAQGSVAIQGRNQSHLPSGIFSGVNQGANGSSQGIEINAGSLSIIDRAQLVSSTEGNCNAGNISINVREDVSLNNSIIITEVTEDFGNGRGGDIFVRANTLDLINGSSLLADTENIGDAGSIFIDTRESVRLSGQGPGASNPDQIVPSQITTTVEEQAIGNGGNIDIATDSLTLTDSAFMRTSTFGQGPAGNMNIRVGSLSAAGGAEIATLTTSSAPAGDLTITATNEVLLSGQSESGPTEVTSASRGRAEGDGGDTFITSPLIRITDGARLSAASEGSGIAGNVNLDISRLEVIDSSIETNAARSSGGDIRVNDFDGEPSGIVILRGDGDVTTDSFGNGGNITLNSIVIAFDDSDILARSEDARGGNITLGPFFTETIPIGAVSPTESNDRVDISADGRLASGTISTPDVSFIKNSLNELSGEIVNTATLTAGSCIARADSDRTGSFVVTGGEGLPQQPGGDTISAYPTGTVQTPAEATATPAIQEPQGVYQLADGRLVLSHECE